MPTQIVAYLSHSYRPEDRAVNIAVWQRLNAAGFVFAVDPPNLDSPMDVTFLERMMRRSDCFVAIVPDRTAGRVADAVEDGPQTGKTWSPYQALECRLALRADKPRLLIVERNIGWGPLSRNESVVSFDRASLTLSNGFDDRVKELALRVRASPQDVPGPLPKVGLLRWDPPHASWEQLVDQVQERFRSDNLDEDEECEVFKIDARSADHAVLAEARRFSAVVVDMNPAVTPPDIVGLLHGAAIPLFRTCLLPAGEDAQAWSAHLGMAVAAPKPQALSRALPALLRGYQVDPRMQPVLFWRADAVESAAQTIMCATSGYQQRERQLAEKRDGREYFLSLRGNRVFISTPGDLLELSSRVKQVLDDAGMPAFHYKRSPLEGGEPWKEQIDLHVRDADLLLGLISSTYWDRPECVDEIECAVRRWERHEMQIVLYGAASPMPPFLGRLQVNPITEIEATSALVARELRQRFGSRPRNSMDQEIGMLGAMVQRHAVPLHDAAELGSWLEAQCGLSKDDATRFSQRLDGLPDKAAKLVRMLMGAIHEESFRGSALGRLCLFLSRLESDAERRLRIDALHCRLRLFPNLHDVRSWNARRVRRTLGLRLRPGAPAELINLATRALGQLAEPMTLVRELGAELAKHLVFDEPSWLADPRVRICFSCSADELMVPMEWAVPEGLTEPLARARPLYRRVDQLAERADRERNTLEMHFASSVGGPPRVLLFGASSPTLPKVADEISTLQQRLSKRYADWEWPADVLVQSISRHEATADALRDHVLGSNFDVLHLAGHAGFDGDDPLIQVASMAEATDKTAFVRADELAGWLRESQVRFVFLNCCEGAASTMPLQRMAGWRMSLCKALLEAGVAEVLAYLWPVGDADALPFARVFYEHYFPDFDAPAALHAARLSIGRDNVLWASSLLVQRAAAGL